jgi:hypothetical protein
VTERPIVPTTPAPQQGASLPSDGQPSPPRHALQIEELEARIAPGGMTGGVRDNC